MARQENSPRGRKPSFGGKSSSSAFGRNSSSPKKSYGKPSSDSRSERSSFGKSFENRDERPKRPRGVDDFKKSFGEKSSSFGEKRTSFGKKSEEGGKSSFGRSKSFGSKSGYGSAPKREGGFKRNEEGDFKKKSFGERSSSFGKSFESREERPKRTFGEKRDGDFGSKRPRTNRFDSKPERNSFGDKPKRSFDSEKSSSFRDDSRPRRRTSENNEGGRPERENRFGKKPIGFDSTRKPTFKRERDEDRPMRYADVKDNDESFTKSDFEFAERKQGRSFESKKKTVSRKPSETREGIRLNKYIANSGICSRREADELISQGLITVNGEPVTELGVMVQYTDVVKYDGRTLSPEKPVYLLLNKPKDFITTTNDPQERRTVMNLVANACKERIYPVGRLDRNTTGLLLFTNDGELAEKLTHPSHNIKKIYQAELSRPISPEDANAILEGLYFEEGRAVVDSMAVLDETRKVVGIEIHIGWNRIVRRIFEAKGYEVVRLDRVLYAGLTKKDLPRGNWRMLTDQEVRELKYGK